MKFLFFITTIIACSVSRAQMPQSFVLSGKLIGRDTGKIVLWYPDTSNKYIRDTAYVKNGSFELTGAVTQPSFAHLIGSPKEGNYTSFFLEGGKQSIVLEENNFERLKMRGSKTQKEHEVLKKQIVKVEADYKSLFDAYHQIQQELKVKSDSIKNAAAQKIEVLTPKLKEVENKIRNVKIAFIRHHPNSYVSATEMLSILDDISLNLADSLFNAFTPAIKNGRVGKLCFTEIEKKRKIKSGAYVADFQAEDINGQSISFSNLRGKFVLIDFWASWCVPCREQMPRIKKVYDQYHSRGFEVFAITLDKKMELWKEAVQKEEVSNWHHALWNKGMEMLFPVQAIPQKLIIDPEGKVIWSSFEENENSWEDVLKERLEL